MKDQHKTKTRLIGELTELRQRVADLERVRDEQRRAEGALRGSRERLDLALNSSNGGLWDLEFNPTDSTETISDQVYLSPVMKRFIGYDNDEFPNSITGWKSRILLEDLIGVNKAAQDHLEGKTDLYEAQYRIRHKDGSIRWIHTRGKILRDEKGKPLRWIGIDWDITEQKRSEEALRESEERYRSLFATNLDAVLLTIPDGRVLAANAAACRMFGCSEEDLIRIGRSGVIDVADPRLLVALEERQRTGKFHGELTCVRSDGSRFPGEISSSVFRAQERELRTSMVIRDISERKHLEERLREYEKVVENSPNMIAVVDKDYKYVLANARFLKYWGLEIDRVVGRPVRDLLGEDVFERVVKRNLEASFRGEVIQYEMKHLYPELGEKDLLIQYFPLRGPDGINEIVSIIQDITGLKRADEALREANQNLRALIQASPLAIVAVDLQANVLIWNPAAERIFGWTEQEVLGKPTPIIPKEEEEEFRELFQKVLEGNAINDFETRRQKKDGTLIDVSLSTAPLYGENLQIRGSIAILEDIVERKNREKERHKLLEQLRTGRKRLQALSGRLVELQETERRDLTRELHDEVGQNLTALSINLTIIQNLVSGESASKATDRINDSQRLVEETVVCIRDVMARLRPPVLDDYGLVAALNWYSGQFMKRNGLPTVLILKGEELAPRLPLGTETAMFRIVQEALNNVAKYAKASQVTLVLENRDETVLLVIDDNGSGFDPVAHHENGAKPEWGLINMRERAESVGGQFKIETTSGKGTKIIVEVPRKR